MDREQKQARKQEEELELKIKKSSRRTNRKEGKGGTKGDVEIMEVKRGKGVRASIRREK